jgi:hypothetical protein
MLTVICSQAPGRVFETPTEQARVRLKHPKRGPYAANKTDDKKKLRDEISRNRVLRMKIATLTRWNQRSLESALSDTKQIIELLENYDVDLSDE